MADRLTQLQEAVNQASYSYRSMRCSVGMPFNRLKSIKPFLYVNDSLRKISVYEIICALVSLAVQLGEYFCSSVGVLQGPAEPSQQNGENPRKWSIIYTH